jgi:hypothetical protein
MHAGTIKFQRIECGSGCVNGHFINNTTPTSSTRRAGCARVSPSRPRRLLRKRTTLEDQSRAPLVAGELRPTPNDPPLW